jgi:hypothetical protein
METLLEGELLTSAIWKLFQKAQFVTMIEEVLMEVTVVIGDVLSENEQLIIVLVAKRLPIAPPSAPAEFPKKTQLAMRGEADELLMPPPT